MITKTAIGLLEGGLFALPHAMGYYTGDESAGGAILNTGGDLLALKAGDAIYNGVVKPKDYAFWGRDQTKSGLMKKPTPAPKNGKQPKPVKYKGPLLAKHWAKSLGHGLGRIAVGMPLFTLTDKILTPLGDKLLPNRRNVVPQQQQPIQQQPVQQQRPVAAATSSAVAPQRTVQMQQQ
jgi:hypothetical protein